MTVPLKTVRTDDALAIAAQNGDAIAADQLAARYMGEISKTVRHYFIVGGSPDDVVGEACLGLTKAILNYKPGRASFRRFAHLCAVSEVQTAIKASTRGKHRVHLESDSLSAPIGPREDSDLVLADSLTDDGPLGRDPLDRVIELADYRRLKDNVATALSKSERAGIIGLMVGATYDEIRESVGLTGDYKAVDNAISRARRKLRPDLEEAA